MKRLYFNGTIITMEKELYADYMVCENGIIEQLGRGNAPEFEDIEKIDLQGNTLMPSFIDPHSHLSSYASSFMQLSLEECHSYGDILNSVKGFIEKHQLKKGQWVNAVGYDQNVLEEGRHIHSQELDKVSPDNPVVVQHKSGHVGVFNSFAMKQLNVDGTTKSMPGGLIEKKNGTPTGYMEEADFVDRIKQVPMPSMDELLSAYIKAQDKYLSYGITTIQEGLMVKQMLPIYSQLLSKNLLSLDTVGYADIESFPQFKAAFPESIASYFHGFKLGGLKIILDGSPQGRTAWMRTPYKGDDKGYFGYPATSDEKVQEAAAMAIENHTQLLAHCNGDRACQQLIDAIKKYGPMENRPVMIHAQLLGIDQLKEVKELNIIPSFFVAHVYHWGDVHIKNFGVDRASHISPAKSALKLDIPFTFHQDSPVIAPDMLETVWCAASRKTKDGVVLGEEEHIDVLDALKAVTINAAYQYFEEGAKGSLAKGKYEDLVILSQNPLEVPIDNIPKIKVIKTIKRGECLYSRQLS